MTTPHPRPVPVLILLLAGAVALPTVVAAVGPELWDDVQACACGLGDGFDVLIDSGNRKVTKAAKRTCKVLGQARDCAGGGEGPAYFKALDKAAKRGRKALKIADKKGLDTEGLRGSFESLRLATRRIVEAGIDELKARPDFETNDRVVRAVVKAECGLESARAALDGKRPIIKSFAAYRAAFAALVDYL